MEAKIIIMLTNNDKTVKDAIEVFEQCKDAPIEFWGFKNVGLPKDQMIELIENMKAAGKTTFLEVVSYSEEECMAGAKVAVELGFDYLLGTIYHKSVFDYLSTQGIKFLPFCGKVSGSPSVLGGSIDEIIEDGKNLLAMGVSGIDLLAFRHEDGAVLAEEYCKRVDEPVVIAGSINSRDRLDFVNKINPWAFTMGTALFKKAFVPEGTVRENLQVVVDYMDKL